MEFFKYEGTGNDFVIVDNRTLHFDKNSTEYIAKLCHRRFGIGADGLILLENDLQYDFKMIYYNSDGNESSMCGNGGRCIVAFAHKLGIIENDTSFMAIDGLHHATIELNGLVSLQMKDVQKIESAEKYTFLNTGSPHHVAMVSNLKEIDVKTEGAKIRYSDLYKQEGSNINFVNQIGHNEFSIRTYERGVEDETLSCGTGATAVAIAMYNTGNTTSKDVIIHVEGGTLEVKFENNNNKFQNVFLKGAATFVFKGTI